MPHILIDATVDDPATIDSVSELQVPIETMLHRLGIDNIKKICRHQHGHGGATLMYVLENVHCVVHSFPEESLLCVDVFADGVWPQDVARCIEELFPCRRVRIKAVVDR
jgi:S-adenosylmethionine/arginine decarboxylase-like enzyme